MESTPEPKVYIAAPDRGSRARKAIFALLALLLLGGAALFLMQRPVEKPSPAIAVVATTPVITPPLPVPAPPTDSKSVLDAIRSHLLFHLPLLNSFEDHSAYARAVSVNPGVVITEEGAHFTGEGYLEMPFIDVSKKPFAFAVWIKPEGEVIGYGLLEQNDGPPNKHLHFLMRDPNKPYLGFYMSDLRADEAVRPGHWLHLVFQYTGTRQQIWIDGKLAADRESDPYGGEHGVTRIGTAPRWDNVPTSFFRGWMKDARLYDIALEPGYIRVLSGRSARENVDSAGSPETF